MSQIAYPDPHADERKQPPHDAGASPDAPAPPSSASSAPAPPSSAPAPPSSASSSTKSTPAPRGEIFRRFAHHVSNIVGTPAMFFVAILIIVAWAAIGPLMHFSDTWQLIINTGTTIATFLIVFLIQNTQNRDARAIHLKLDELIRGVKGARNRVIDLEERTDEELLQLEREFRALHEHAAETRTRRKERKERHHGA